MRFIHCADLHIGKYQTSSQERSADFTAALSRIGELSREHGCSYILIAGDLFDTRALSAQTMTDASAILAGIKASGVSVIATEGNHDRALSYERDSWLTYLDSIGLLTLLRPRIDEKGALIPGVYEDGEIVVYGAGYPGAAAPRHAAELAQKLSPSQKPVVVLLHAGLSAYLPQDLARVSAEDLSPLAAACDYLALGHIHHRYSEKNIYNPGSTEYTDISEAKRGDEKGVFLVTGRGKELAAEFLPLSPRPHIFLSFETEELSQVREHFSTHDYTGAVVELTLRTGGAVDAGALGEELAASCHAFELLISVMSARSLSLPSERHTDMAALERDILTEEFSRLSYDGRLLALITDFACDYKDAEMSSEDACARAAAIGREAGL